MRPFKYWIVFSILCLTLGFLNGFWYEPKEQQITVLSLKKTFLDDSFADYLKRVYNAKISWIYVNNQNELESYMVKTDAPDLVIAPTLTLNYFFQQDLLLRHSFIEKTNLSQSPSLLFNLNSSSQIPFAWELKKDGQEYQLEVLSVGIPSHTKSHEYSLGYLKIFIESLKKVRDLKEPYQLSLHPESQKNQDLELFLRSHELNKIKIEN